MDTPEDEVKGRPEEGGERANEAVEKESAAQFSNETMTAEQKEQHENAMKKQAEELRKNIERRWLPPRKPPADPQRRQRQLELLQQARQRASHTDREASSRLDKVMTQLLEGGGYDFRGDEPLRRQLLGRLPVEYDESVFLHRLLGSDTDDGNDDYMRRLSRHLSRHPWQLFVSPTVCKFIICDRRVPDWRVHSSEMPATFEDAVGIDALYKRQLRIEAEDAEVERARARARNGNDIHERKQARLFLKAYEEAEARGEPAPDPKSVWDAFWNREAPWIRAIQDDKVQWGYSIYKTPEVLARPDGLARFLQIFHCDDLAYWDTNFEGFLGGIRRLPNPHGRERLDKYAHVDWVECAISEGAGIPPFIRHFREHRKTLKSPRMLQNTFVILTSDCIEEALDRYELHPPPQIPPQGPGEHPIVGTTRKLSPHDLYAVCVWVYDADWEPPNPDIWRDEDGYEGKVLVRLTSLYSWFYYARKETSIPMKDLWWKAQRHPQGYWHCETDSFDRTLPSGLV